ncbi:MAG: hypothetical protein ACUVXF_00820 [Desulfobaccales bacterium]
MPTGRYCLAAVAGPHGKIYALGGLRSCAGLSIVEAFDPLENSWEAKSPMNTGRWGLAAAVDQDGKIYAVGGARRVGQQVEVLGTVEMGTAAY